MAPKKLFFSSVFWNLLLLTTGAFIFGVGFKSIALPHGFITGGTSGVCLLLYYMSGHLTPGLWYFILNVPLFLIGWKYISKRFFLYSLYGMGAFTLSIDFVSFQIPINDQILAVLAGGAIMGAGAGITLNSLGSAGGNDIVAIILNQKFNVRIGAFIFAFNLVLFSLSFWIIETDLVLYSAAMSYVTSQVVDYFLSIFNQRKMSLIITQKAEPVAEKILKKLNRGATFLQARGAYSGKQKEVILTVVNNYQLKRLEEIVFGIDSEAFLITENTFNVLGKGFSRRKVY
jgi:uncharacterized membrane-anchored protein YitT (DUF2179 family)